MRYFPALLITLALALSASACFPVQPANGTALTTDAVAAKPELKLVWRTHVSGMESFAFRPQEYARPVFVTRSDDIVVGTSDGNVTRLRAGSGEIVWRKLLSSTREDGILPIHADPVVHNGVIYVGSINGSVLALDYDDGTILWEYRAEDAIESTLTVSEGRLFFTDAREILYAVDAETGKLLWRFQRPAPEFFTIKGAGTPVIDGDAVYCGFADGTLVAVQIDTGETIWTSDLTNEEVEFTDIDMPVIVGDRLLYAGSYSGGVFGISRLDGTVQWRVDVPSVAQVKRYEGMLYVASAQGRVVAIDGISQKPVWSFKFMDDSPVELVPYGPYVFVSTSSGPLMILDRVTGKPLSKWNPSTGFNTPVVFDGNRGFLLSNGGYLYSFELAF
jgi:outer membrane protein assembly factor BamB